MAHNALEVLTGKMIPLRGAYSLMFFRGQGQPRAVHRAEAISQAVSAM